MVLRIGGPTYSSARSTASPLYLSPLIVVYNARSDLTKQGQEGEQVLPPPLVPVCPFIIVPGDGGLHRRSPYERGVWLGVINGNRRFERHSPHPSFMRGSIQGA